jgi:hypothetical protein
VLDLEERLRVPAIETTIHALKPLAAQGIPVVLTGDFNSPSYLDWTPAVARHRALVPYAVKWPASEALSDAGFVDSYREVYPNPVKHPGYTWSPGGPETRRHDFPDRIDWVLHAGPATAIGTALLGEPGGRDVDQAFGPPYPTDHRGVTATLRLTPAPAPNLVSPSTRRVTIGSRLRVAFHAPGRRGERVAIMAKHAGSRRVVASAPTGPTGTTDGVALVSTRRLHERKYTLALIGRNGGVFSMQPIWAYRASTHATVTTRRSYRVGEPISVSWTKAPGMALDWISVFRCRHGKCAGPGGYLTYDYTHTRIEGTLRLSKHDALVARSDWPLPTGHYIARLLVDDGYVVVARSKRFHIVDP